MKKSKKPMSRPWSMIDKITPRPDKKVEAMLAESGVDQIYHCGVFCGPVCCFRTVCQLVCYA